MTLPDTYLEGFHALEAVQKMPYNRLGNTDMVVSLLSFGGAGLSGFYEEFEEEEAINVVREALKAGINYIDTSPYYGEGRSEKVIGQALKGIPRKTYYISTKVGRNSTKLGELFDYSPKSIKSRFEISLKLLGVEYVDILFLHDVEFAKLDQIIHEILPALKDIVKEGKARYIGISGYPLSRLETVVKSAMINIDVVLTYCRDTLIDSLLEEYYPFFKSKGLGVINASPTAQGLLTNAGPPKWQVGDKQTKELCAKCASMCKERGVELGKLAVYYSLTRPSTETLLVGMNSCRILDANLALVHNGLSQIEKDTFQYLQDELLKGVKNLNWEGVELSMYNMKME